MFALHPRLAADSLVLGDLPLSRVLLINDSRYPWLVLVPKRVGIQEIYQLNETDQQQLLRESSALANLMQQCCGADKMNIAAIGNLVPQLHVHHVARYRRDDSWPKPVWGRLPAVPYCNGRQVQRLWQQRLQALANFSAAD